MRNTHAKQFPSEAWRTRFGELLGASHTLEYRFWQYGGLASAGLKELAEHGSTKALEREIKETASVSINFEKIVLRKRCFYFLLIGGRNTDHNQSSWYWL